MTPNTPALISLPQPGGKLLASAKAAVPTISEHAHSMSVTGSAKNLAAALAELLTATTRAQEACGSLEIDGALYKVRQLERDLEEVRKTARGGNLMPLPGETVSNGVLLLRSFLPSPSTDHNSEVPLHFHLPVFNLKVLFVS